MVPSAIILVLSQSDPSNATPPFLVAYDVTLPSPFQESYMSMRARGARAVASAAEKRKKSNLATKMAAIPGEALLGLSTLGWNLGPPAFGFLESPSDATSKVIEIYTAAFVQRMLDRMIEDSPESEAWISNLINVGAVQRFVSSNTPSVLTAS